MASKIQRTLVLAKPDAIRRGLLGVIIERFERKQLKLSGIAFMKAPETLIQEHYKEHQGKDFLKDLIKFMESGPLCAMCWCGPDAVRISRQLIGATDPSDRLPGTIRGDYSNSLRFNLVHASDSIESAKREIDIWFQSKALLEDVNPNI